MTQPLLSQLIGLSPEQRRAVLERVRQRGAGGGSIPRLNRQGTDNANAADTALPASFGQDRLWFLWRLAPGSATYHVSWCYEVTGGLEVERLASAVDALVERHEVLRTTLHEQDGQIVQRVGKPWRCGLAAAPATADEAFDQATASARELFDLSTGPLLRVRAWELAPDRHVVAFTTHHVVMDGWSLDIFERELWALYDADGDHAVAGLNPLDIQYADYAAWHRGLIAGQADADLAYWKQALDGATPACPAPDHPAPEHTEFSGDEAIVTVPASDLDWIAATRGAAGTEFVALFAIWCLFLARHTGQRDLTVGTLVSGRSHPDSAALIGYFANTLALRVRIDPGADFPGYLREVRAAVLDAFAHQEIPFDHVVRAVAPRRTAARNPLFTTLFSYTPAEGADWHNRTLANGLELSALPVTVGGSHLDLSLAATRTPEGLVLRLEYSTDLYDPATIEGYLSSLTGLLDAVSLDPATPLRALLGDEDPARTQEQEQERAEPAEPAEYIAPRTATEQHIARIWADLLGTDVAEVGAADDFFAVGGHSLLAVRLALQLSTNLDLDFPVHQVFTTPTIAGQAAYADELSGQGAAAPIPARPHAEDGAEDGAATPASFGQERLWFLWRLAPQSATYHVSWCYEAAGLDVSVLALAVDAMVARHAILRTTLHEEDGEIVQRIGPAWHCELAAVPATPARATAAAEAAANELFDLSAGPLLRVRAWETGPAAHLLLFTAHHCVIDEWSLEVFERELWALYSAGGDAASCELPELTVQYSDYAAWHRDLIAGQADADLAFWRQALDGATPVCPAPDHPAPERTDFAGEQACVTVPASELDWLATTRTAAGTDFVALFALWCLFLARHTGQRDLTVGTLVSGRSHPDTAELIGFFVNTLALRVRVDPGAGLPGYLRSVRTAVLDAFAHQEVPFDQVVRAVAPQRTAARNPLFTAMFSYATETEEYISARELPGGVTLTPLAPAGGGSHFDLSLTAARTPAGLMLRLEYSTALYDPATIDGYLDSLTSLLAAISADPAARLHAFLEPTPREQQLLSSWNDVCATPASAKALHDLIAAQAAVTPEVVAVEADDTCLTYRQLDAGATTLARRLRRAGVRDGDIVGIHLRPGAVAISAILAVWKAGAALLPLDPDLPPARVAAMVDDARPALLITEAPSPCPELDLLLTGHPDQDQSQDQDEKCAGELPAVGPDHLAYLIYTSGSTGQPKAVMIHHGGLSNHATAQVLVRTGAEPKRVAAGTSAFIADFFFSQLATLAGGHTLVLLTKEQRQDPRYLVGLAADPDRAVSAVDCTTSQLQLLVEAGLLDAPHPPRVVCFGGEACPPDLWTTLRSYPELIALNAYGPAETSVDATLFDLAQGPVPLIGRPYGNVRVRLLDDRQRPVPPGTVGELCVAGPGVGYGYLGRPAQTAEVFIPDPGGPPGSRLYRTGDLARFDSCGQLEYHGRNDHQIKVLGQRVEPEEVETALRAHPGIAGAAVTAHSTPAGPQLTGHLIPATGASLDLGELRAWLAQRLPAAAVPASFRLTDSFPRTTGGKLDRKALTVIAAAETARAVTKPASTPAEHAIAAIWADLLGSDPSALGVHDDFFALGGHSLLAARLALRVSAGFGTDLPLHEVFSHPTIAGLATWISEHAGTPAAAPIARLAREPGTDVPASHAQERLWFLWQLAPHSATYHVTWCYETTALDIAALAAAVDAMIERHEILRTTLHEHDGQITQRIGPARHCDLTAVPATPEEAAAAADAAAAELFDLSAGPLLRVRAWATGPGTHLLLFTAHHAVIDEWSMDVFERELWTLYTADGDPAAAGLTDPPVQYADYAAWHRALVAATADQDTTWWKETLDQATPASPAPDHPAPDRTSFSGDQVAAIAEPAVSDWLDATRVAAATTDFVVLLAVWCLFLARHTGRRDITIGTPVSGRNHPDTAGVIGFFVNTLALRVRVDPALTFPAFVGHVRRVVLDAFAHQELPFDQVVRAAAPQRTAARNPLFTTSYSHDQAGSEPDRELPAGLSLTPVLAADDGSHFDLSLTTARTPAGLALHLAYSTDLYDRATIDGYLDSLTGLLTAISGDPVTPLRAFLEPTAREQQLLACWNDASATPASETPLHDLIAAQAAATPDAIAVEADDTCLSFLQLDAEAASLARRLRRAGVRDGDIVGVHLPPSAVAITATLAVWKAGAAFLPLDPDLPAARITAMIEDARPALVITDTATPAPELDFVLGAPGAPGAPGMPGADAGAEADGGDGALPAVGPDYLAYLIYTSGSTGQPKAVMIQHRNLSNHVTAQLLPWLASAGGERMRMATGTSAFISDFFFCQLAALAGGHTLVVLTQDQRQDPLYLVGLAAEPDRAVTALEITTSQLQLLVEAGLTSAPYPPRAVAFGGEACPPDLWRMLRAHPAIAAFNSYGPTETTVEATMVALAESSMPVIGRAFGNAAIRILDARQRPVPPGTVGELCIAGPGVGPGYLGRPAQTAELFIPDPGGPPGSRLYRTGDLARFTRDGLLEYHGRNDQQIKVLGQRVEPEEVETALRAHPGIAGAAVTAQLTPAGHRLTAHLIAAGTVGAPEPGELRRWLAERVPAAAVPSAFRYTDSFPLALGGKLDRKALTAIAAAETASAVTTPASTPAEHAIAGIWADLLGIEADHLGVHDDFFALGGHSLLAARLALRVSAGFGTDLPLHGVFSHPTIAGLATWISEHAGTPAAEPITRSPRQIGAEIPASHAQERLWFLWQLAPDSATYHVTWCYETTALNVSALGAAVDAMIERHEILRTTLHEHDGQITQRIGPPWHCELNAVPATPKEAAAAADIAAAELFDLSAGPLLRVHAWATGPGTHLLLFTAHHAVIDEWSMDVFERELWALYSAHGDATAAGLSDPPIQYADYAAWHRALVAATADQDTTWWTEALDGAEPASPAPDHPAPDRTDFSGDHARTIADAATVAWLDAARADAATTDFVVLLALYSVFLARHAGSRDITVGAPVSGRSHPDTAALIGFLVNTLALRIRVDPALSFPEHIAVVRQVVVDAFAHQELPFEHVVRAAAPQRTAASNPLFTTSYSHEITTGAATARTLPGGTILAPHLAGGGAGSHFDLSLMTARTGEGLYLGLDYSTALYDPATIDAYLGSLTDLLSTLAAHPGTRVHQLLEPSPREAAWLRDWNGQATTATSSTPLHDLVARQAAATPDAAAIEAADTCLTYRQLDTAATAIARRLRRAGVRAGDIVGVHLAPGAAAITAILAAWRAGAACLPLDPDLPAARTATMITDAEPALLITETPSPRPDLDFLLTAPPSTDQHSEDQHSEDQDDEALPATGPDQLAYLIYTSGSTGRPKAVMISHRSLSNHAIAQVLPRTSRPGSTRMRVATGTSAFIADFFIAQLATLAGGHTLVVLNREQRQDPRYLTGLAADPGRAVTALDCTTSQLQLFVEAGLLDAPHPPCVVAFGGESCPPDLWHKLCGYPAITAVNTYGPAEATVEATIATAAESPVPLIGRPFGNAVVRLLDDQQRLVPPGTVGELCIAGPGVGLGYLGRPDLTADAFIPDPVGPPGSRLYRTGDLARIARDGLLEFHGRNDHQLKILGQRVEPGEIEAALRARPDLAAAAVTAHATPAGPQLTAHLIPAPGSAPDPEELRAWLAGLLPAAAVPAAIRFTGSFPFTTGGKLDRKALTAAGADLDAARPASAPPGTPAEYQIAAIWADLLGYDGAALGVHDDFFALGGHSLLAARLALRLSADFDVTIPLHEIFAHPTIAGQATWIDDHADTPAAASIPRLPRGGDGTNSEGTAQAPASYAQERLWFLWQLAPDSTAYHVPWAYQTTGLDIAALAAAVDAMIERHEVLRTTLHDDDGQVIQRIGPAWQCGLTAVPAVPAQAAAAADAAARELFDLTAGPLLRVRAWATGPDTHLVLFTAHHSVVDEWSLEIFERELWALYAAGGDAAAAALPEAGIQYASYAVWHRELVAATADDDAAWWMQALEGAEPASPVPDHPAPDRTDFSGDHAETAADPAAVAWLDKARATASTTDYVVLLALYSIFLARHSGRRDLTIGAPVSGRGHPDTAGLIGFLVNTLTLRIRVDLAATFPEHVRHVRKVVLDAFAHQEIPFEHVVRAVAPQRAAARNPLFTTSFAHNAATPGSVTLPGGLILASHATGDTGGSHFDLSLTTTRTPDGLTLGLEYSTALYDSATITAYLASLTDLLATLSVRPDAPVGELLEPTAREAAQLRAWNYTATPTSATPMHDLITIQAAATPEAIAIEAPDTTLTYRQLDIAATALARHLIRHGTRPGDIIAIHIPPTAAAITAILAAWKAGAAFLPLDPDLPAARIAAMIDDARPARILTTTPTTHPHLDLNLAALADDPPETPLPEVSPHQLAYLMYTSGSTGQPKAVMIHHGGVSNYAAAQMLPRLRDFAGDTPLRLATGTSAFISDFFMAQLVTLGGGHTLVVLSSEQRQDPRYLVSLAADPDRAVTALEVTTSQLQLLAEAGLFDSPHPPRVAMFGGEHCPPDLWTKLRGYQGLTAVNTYGPAETSVDATLHKLSESLDPLIGRPYGNTVIRILDDRQHPVPPGTAGELCIAGPGVGYGYLSRPVQTATVFIPDPDGPPGSRIYRTGDLARFTRGGALEFLGRNDLQIKILGQRVEPEEVEATLRSYPGIAAAAVTARSGPAGHQLIAHLLPAPETTPDLGELRAWLAQRLPAPAIPASFRVAGSFPVTTGGKLDRKALTAIGTDLDVARPPLTPPATPAQHQIAAIWADLFGQDPRGLGIHDDFFASGGHSLLAARLALRLSAEFDANIPLHQVFASPTIAGQAAWIEENAGTAAAAPIALRDRVTAAEVASSHAQERVWFLWQLAPDSPTYHVPWAYQATGLDVAVLAAAIDAMIERHEILRTTLHDRDGQIVQRIGPAWHCELTAVAATPEEAAAAARAAADELFDLSAGPLLRVRAWRTGPATHLLLFTAHHVVIDEWSLDIFERELWELYAAGGDAAAAALPDLVIQYADYAAWHRELTASRGEQDLAWWTQALDGAEPASPVPDHAAPDRTDFSGDTAEISADPAVLAWLDATRAAAATTDFVVLLALYSLFLARHAGRRDLTIGTPVSGRDHPDTAGLIGFCVNTLALRVLIDPGLPFPDHIARVRQVVLDAFAHQEIPFEHVVRAVAPQRAAARNPLFTTSFAHNLATPGTMTLPGGLTLAPYAADGSSGSHFDLTLNTTRTPQGLVLGLEYSTALYERSTIESYLDSLADLLSTLTVQPGTQLGQLLAPTAREAARLREWNDTATPATTTPLHDLVAAQAAATPEATAVEAPDTTLTYRQLDTAATALARHLIGQGVRPGDIIAVHLPPTASAITAILAVWKAGAAFLPLDPDLPRARIAAMIDDARPARIITVTPTPRRDLDLDPAALTTDPPAVALPDVDPSQLAFLIFTSGSTGQPKAVMIHHAALSNYTAAQMLPRLRAFAPGEVLRLATGTSAFISDFFIAQLTTLAGGHALVVLSKEQRQDPRYLVSLAADQDSAITALECTTSQLQLYAEAGLLDAPHPPRLAMFAGEACPPDLWTRLRGYPGVTSVNAYGPAEAMMDATQVNVADHPDPVIGRAYGNTAIRLLDDEQRPVAPGVTGELCIAGPGVGYGYLGRPAQTASAFIPDADGPPGSRLYRTGDLARYTSDGLLEYHGRNDLQIKILGQRVEPEEIEAILRAHPGVTAAAVTAHPTPAGLQLTAHLIPAGGTAPDGSAPDSFASDPGAIRTWLAQRLPAAAIPASFLVTDEFPRTASGKLDRKTLTTIAAQAESQRAHATPPSTPAEHAIAAIWSSLLGQDSVGIHDDFFALGGHSLLAARLAMRLQAELDLAIPLHQVFAHPTIAAQAAYADAAGGSLSDSSVVPMGGSPDQPPLILVHPIGGAVVQYAELAATLSSTYHVLGVHADPLATSQPATLTERAAGYARQLAPVLAGRQPVIAGWSAGGIIAHELAVQLQESGLAASGLILIDTSPPENDDNIAADLERLRPRVRRDGPGRLLAEEGTDRFLAAIGVDQDSFAKLDAATAATLMGFWQVMLTSLTRHQPRRFDGPARLILSADQDDESSEHAITIWQRHTGQLSFENSEANHFQLLRHPWVSAIAELVRRPAPDEL